VEHPPAIVPGQVTQLSPLVRRVTAPNPGMMTGPGTNAYIIGTDALALIDPGPDIDVHLKALLDAVGERLRWILCTHTHMDHSPCARALKAATGAELIGRSAPPGGTQDAKFAPDRVFENGDVLDCGSFTLRALHTPGHASNHLCYLLDYEQVLFTGDHVMQGSTVVISPPDGDMVAYLKSLTALLDLDIVKIAPGHGHLIDSPHDEARKLIAHRLRREQKVVAAFAAHNPATLDQLVPVVYADTPTRMHGVARRSLHAHLIKLQHEGRVELNGEYWKLRV
jgi:glyoxylase-like metal-dependent hydrolase (beta-lactamase superfamily II)